MIIGNIIKSTIILLLITISTAIAQPSNDRYEDAIEIKDPTKCSADSAFSNVDAIDESSINAPANWPGAIAGKDVWFKFTAIAYDLNITVKGNNTGGGSSGGTLLYPLIALYKIDKSSPSGSFFEQMGNFSQGFSISSYQKFALVIGQEYYIRVSAAFNISGTFTLCIDNYFAPLKAGQDYETASFLCDKRSFTQTNVLGSGLKNTETAGSCLGMESNSVWYKWVAANDGTLTMDISPLKNSDDIDWVLYDLGLSGDINNKILLRCAAGHGVSNIGCPSDPLYNKTGMDLSSTDLFEESGCGFGGQNGYVKYVDLQKGHTYALIVDNFSSANSGFKIEFGGTSEFAGPEGKINLTSTDICTIKPNFIFSSTGSVNYDRLLWKFGEDASIATSSDPNPPPINYTSPGYKTVTLELFNSTDCSVIITKSFLVDFTNIKPTAAFSTQPKLPINKSAPYKLSFINESKDADSYFWDFGDGNTSTEENPTHTYKTTGDFKVTLTAYNKSVCNESISVGQTKNAYINIFFIPNTFSPNNDGVNDVFNVKLPMALNYKIEIFNRYGVPLYLSRNIDDPWNGLYKNEAVPSGTYYYVINAVDLYGNPILKSGSITIIR